MFAERAVGNSLRNNLVSWRWWVIVDVVSACDLDGSLGVRDNDHASPGRKDGAADDVMAAAVRELLFVEEEAICSVFGRVAVIVSPYF